MNGCRMPTRQACPTATLAAGPVRPRRVAPGLAARNDVATSIDAVVPRASRLQYPARILKCPALDQSGWIGTAVGSVRSDVEIALARAPDLVAQRHNRAQVRTRVGLLQLASDQAADLAVRLVRAEASVNLAEIGKDFVQGGGADGSVAHVQANCRAHDLFHTAQAGQGSGGRQGEWVVRLRSSGDVWVGHDGIIGTLVPVNRTVAPSAQVGARTLR